MASEEFKRSVEACAAGLGAAVWEGVPVGAPNTCWPDDNLERFVAKIAPLAPRILYLDPEYDVFAVFIEGVLHFFGDTEYLTAENGGFAALEDDWSVEVLHRPSAELRNQAKLIANDARFDPLDPFSVDLVLESFEVAPGAPESDMLRREARMAFDGGPGTALDATARRIARELMEHPDFDPLLVSWQGEDWTWLVDRAVAGMDPRLVQRVRSAVFARVNQQGLRDRAERELIAELKRIMTGIPRLVLDQVGFSSRNLVRDALVAPYLGSIPAARWKIAAYWIKRLENEANHATREARYAAAVQSLLALGRGKKAISEILKLSPGLVERLAMDGLSRRLELDANDPIVLELAPELA